MCKQRWEEEKGQHAESYSGGLFRDVPLFYVVRERRACVILGGGKNRKAKIGCESPNRLGTLMNVKALNRLTSTLLLPSISLCFCDKNAFFFSVDSPRSKAVVHFAVQKRWGLYLNVFSIRTSGSRKIKINI